MNMRVIKTELSKNRYGEDLEEKDVLELKHMDTRVNKNELSKNRYSEESEEKDVPESKVINKRVNKTDLFKKRYCEASLEAKAFLDLKWMDITDKDVPELLFFLQTHPDIKEVDLSYNKLSTRGAKYLLSNNQTVTSLNLTGNRVNKNVIVTILEQKNTIIHHLCLSAGDDKILNIQVQDAPLIKGEYKNTFYLDKLEKKLSKTPGIKERLVSPLTNTVLLGSFVGGTEGLLSAASYTVDSLKSFLATSEHGIFRQTTGSATMLLGTVSEYIDLSSYIEKLHVTAYRKESKIAEAVMRMAINTHMAGTHVANLLANAGFLGTAATAVTHPLASISGGVAAWAQVCLSVFKLQRAIKKLDKKYWVEDQIKKYCTIDKKLHEIEQKISVMKEKGDDEEIKKLTKKSEAFKTSQSKIKYRLNIFYNVHYAQSDENTTISAIENFFEEKKIPLEKRTATTEEKLFIDNIYDKQKENVLGHSVDLAFKVMSAVGATCMAVGAGFPPVLLAGTVLLSVSTLLSMSMYLIPKIADKILHKRYLAKMMREYSPQALIPPEGLSEDEQNVFFHLSDKEKKGFDMAFSLLNIKKTEKTAQCRLEFYKELLALSQYERSNILQKSIEKYLEKTILKTALGEKHETNLPSHLLDEKTRQRIASNYLRAQKLGKLGLFKPFLTRKVDPLSPQNLLFQNIN